MTLNSCKEKKLAATGIEFHSSSGGGTYFHSAAPSVPDCPRQAQRGQLKLARGDSCVGTIYCIRRIMMPRLGLSRSYWRRSGPIGPVRPRWPCSCCVRLFPLSPLLRQTHFVARSQTPRNCCVRFVAGVTVGSRNTCYPAARYGLTRTGLRNGSTEPYSLSVRTIGGLLV